MKVRLIALTKPVIEGLNNSQDLTVFVARVSNPSNQMNMQTGPKLLNYCIKHKHFSIFEHAYMTVEIVTSRGISAQILRHRSFTFQEFSQRYSVATEFELYPARRQDLKNRQNSIDDMPEEDKTWFKQAQEAVQQQAQSLYDQALQKGIAKEQARFLLPLGTQTTIYMTGNLRSWIHYIELRADPATQKEHRDIALECKRIFTQEFPDIAEALGWKEPKK